MLSKGLAAAASLNSSTFSCYFLLTANPWSFRCPFSIQGIAWRSSIQREDSIVDDSCVHSHSSTSNHLGYIVDDVHRVGFPFHSSPHIICHNIVCKRSVLEESVKRSCRSSQCQPWAALFMTLCGWIRVLCVWLEWPLFFTSALGKACSDWPVSSCCFVPPASQCWLGQFHSEGVARQRFRCLWVISSWACRKRWLISQTWCWDFSVTPTQTLSDCQHLPFWSTLFLCNYLYICLFKMGQCTLINTSPRVNVPELATTATFHLYSQGRLMFTDRTDHTRRSTYNIV